MFSSQLIRMSTRRAITRRAFSSSTMKAAHFKEGVYSNIPFKVKDRKIPYGIIHFGFLGVGFLVPFIAVYVQLKKSGNI